MGQTFSGAALPQALGALVNIPIASLHPVRRASRKRTRIKPKVTLKQFLNLYEGLIEAKMPNFYSPKEDIIPEHLKSDLRATYRKNLEQAFITLHNQERQYNKPASVQKRDLRVLDGTQILLCTAMMSPSSRRDVISFMIDALFDDRKDEFTETKKKELNATETLILFFSVLKAMSLVLGNSLFHMFNVVQNASYYSGNA